jgi:fumarate reductase flavoprotein subunit
LRRVEEVADVVVVGAGAAGSIAAITAADRGLRVVLIEKDLAKPTNTALSSGGISAAGTRHQQAAAIDDSPELMARDILAYNHGHSDPDLTMAICEVSARLVTLLEQRVGLELGLETSVLLPGHSRRRLHFSPSQTGSELAECLRQVVGTHPRIRLHDHATLTDLLRAGDRVAGIRARDGELEVASPNVILAGGGFAADRRRLLEYAPEVADATYIGADTHSGEVIGLAVERFQAALEHMGGYQLHAHVLARSGRRLAGAVTINGGIMVDRHGRRFVSEDRSPSELGIWVLEQPDRIAIDIFDERIASTLARGSMLEALARGDVFRSARLRDLGEMTGVDPTALEDEVRRYNDAVVRGHDWLGRASMPDQLRPPYFGAVVTAGLSNTVGGLRTSTAAEVLRRDGSPIGGLYAAGATAAGISGDRGGGGYLPGNGLLHALALGFIAGNHCATT